MSLGRAASAPRACIAAAVAFAAAVALGMVPGGGLARPVAHTVGPLQLTSLIVVDTSSDEVDPADGLTSLREAISDVNSAAYVLAVIALANHATYSLTRCLPVDDDTNLYGDLDHTSAASVAIVGNDATVRQTCPGSRVIDQHGANSLILTDGTLAGGDASGPGGAVLSSGGGIVYLKNEVVRGNRSSAAGGAVFAAGDAVITNTTIVDNVAAADAAVTAQHVALIESTVAGNASVPGAATVHGIAGVDVVGSTLNTNSSPAISTAGQLRAFGAAVGTTTDGGPSCSASTTVSLGFNFSSDATCAFGAAGDVTAGGDPMLARRETAREVPVLVPLAGSPLLERVPTGSCRPPAAQALVPSYANLEVDARGVLRPQGSACDIGSIEATSSDLAPTAARAERGWSAAAPALPATTIAVQTTLDELDPNDGQTSLREAVAAANTTGAGDVTISLAAKATYQLTLCVDGDDDINLAGDLDATSAANVTLDANGATIRPTCPAVRIIDQRGPGNFTLKNAVLAGGYAATQPGGAIFASGGGTLFIDHSVVRDSRAAAAGGGVSALGDAVVVGSTIIGNRTGESEGGIALIKHLTLVDSTVTGNSAPPSRPEGGPPIGGAGAIEGIDVVYSTLHGNTSTNLDAGFGQLRAFGSAVGTTTNDGPACSALTTDSRGYDFSSDGSCGFGTGPGDAASGGDPRMTLQESGGPPVLVPDADSPLLDKIPPSDCLPARALELVPSNATIAVDERGIVRPQGPGCEIGAVEVVAGGATAVAVTSFTAARTGRFVTLRWQVASSTALLGFNVYGGSRRTLIRLNPTLIPADSIGRGRSYMARVRSPRGHGAANYWLEEVLLAGARVRHGPVRAGR